MLENNYSTHGIRLWGTTKFGSIQKHTPHKIVLDLFPIEDLRQAVETAKSILTKEKFDKQLAGQSSSTPFLSIRDGHHRKVSFDTREKLGDMIDKLVVMIGRD